MVTLTPEIHPSTQEAEVGELLKVQGQNGLYNDQPGLQYKTCLEKKLFIFKS